MNLNICINKESFLKYLQSNIKEMNLYICVLNTQYIKFIYYYTVIVHF
jgi:hypothetical protein